MSELSDKPTEHLEWLRRQLVNDLSPQGRIQLERVINEMRRRRTSR